MDVDVRMRTRVRLTMFMRPFIYGFRGLVSSLTVVVTNEINNNCSVADQVGSNDDCRYTNVCFLLLSQHCLLKKDEVR